MTKKLVKKTIAVVLSAMIAALMLMTGSPIASAEVPTNVGLAAHALKAYREGWSYVWGGTSYGAVDCSGLIYSYYGVGGNRVDMLGSSSEWGYVSNGIPRIHGLGLHHPGHVGVYIGSGIAVDARDEYWGVVQHNVYNKNWNEWFKIAGVSYPYSGWVLLDGDSYYYENGQYVVDTSRTLDGVTYYFNSAGVSDMAPPSSAYQATDYSSPSAVSQDPPSYYYEDDDDDDDEEALRLEEERKRQEEEERQRQAEAEEAERQRQAEEEAERQRQAEEAEKQRQAEEAAAKKKAAEEEKKRKAEEAAAKKKAEEQKKIEEEQRKKAEEEAKIVAEYDSEDDEENKTVSSIQTRLYELGYLTDKATGYFGEDTVNAVMLFQNKNELSVTGSVDAKTLQVLKSTKAVSNFDLLETGAFDDGSALPITALQVRLTELKYYYDDITGYYGDLTASAVKQFQKNNDLDATGTADPDTQLKIFSEDAKINPNAGSVMYGEKGAVVLKLQKRLIELRYLSGVANETFDDETLAAVNAYQKTAGFEETDHITADQLEALNAEDAPKSPEYDVLKYGYSGEDVAQLQSRLASLKYYDGKTSGVYGSSVTEAVENFQKDNNLPVTGLVDAETQEAIKTEAQRESTRAGEQLILQTATISDNALAGVADSKTVELTVNGENTSDFTKMAVVLGAVLTLALVFAIIFVVELKKKKKAAAAKRAKK